MHRGEKKQTYEQKTKNRDWNDKDENEGIEGRWDLTTGLRQDPVFEPKLCLWTWDGNKKEDWIYNTVFTI